MNQDSEYHDAYLQLQLISKHTQDSSKLYLVMQKSTSLYRMAKKICIFDDSNNSEDQLFQQVKLLKQLNNPHILKYYDVYMQGEDLILILQFCQEGDLLHYIEKRKQRKEHLSQKLIMSWTMQLLMGIQCIHTRNILHRSISMHNVYLNHQGDLKIGSFVSAKVLQNTIEKAMTIIGPPCNMSPEMVEGKPYDSKADIWALGCLIYELATFQSPFKFGSLPQLYDAIVKNPPPELPVKYSKHVAPLFKKMMKKNPLARPSATQLLQEEVFMSLMKEYTRKKKIDALDLREVVPKKLAIHRKKNRRPQQNIMLPSLSDSKIDKKPTSNSNSVQKRQYKQKSKDNQEQAKKKLFLKSSGSKKIQLISGPPRNIPKQIEKKTGQKSTPEDTDHKDSPQMTKSKGLEIPKYDYDVQNSEEEERITKPNLQESQYISLLCQVHLEFLTKKYSPNMEEIFQRTVEFDDFS